MVLEALSQRCTPLLVVLAPDQAPPQLSGAPAFRWLRDKHQGEGPLAGVLAGLAAVETNLAVVVSTDLPLLNPAVFEHLVSLAPGFDVVLPVVHGFEQPLLAVYRPGTSLPVLASAFESGIRRLVDAMHDLRVRRVAEEELRDVDPELFSFRNANTEEELAELERIARAMD